MQEVSSTVQTQGQKGAVKEETAIHISIQTQAKIQIQIRVTHSHQW